MISNLYQILSLRNDNDLYDRLKCEVGEIYSASQSKVDRGDGGLGTLGYVLEVIKGRIISDGIEKHSIFAPIIPVMAQIPETDMHIPFKVASALSGVVLTEKNT